MVYPLGLSGISGSRRSSGNRQARMEVKTLLGKARKYHGAEGERAAAGDLILDRGYVGMTVEHVRDRFGITKGAFFHRFTTKHDLAKALLQQFDDQTRQLIRDSFRKWRELPKEKFEAIAIARKHPPQAEVSAASLADAFTVALEGAFITGKAMDEPGLVSDRLRHFCNYVELLFRQSRP